MPTAREELHTISQLLHLTHHRNKNQHRLSKWYKYFSVLRRSIAKLISELESLELSLKFSSGKKGEEGRYVKAAREKVEDRVRFLEDRLMERCFLAFTNLVADNQYAALGLMLLANLARVKRIIRPLGKPKPSDEIKGGEQESLSEVPRVEADLGEVIKREEIQVEEEIEKKIPDEDEDEKVELKKPKKKKRSMIAEESPKLKTAESTPAKRPKKKRKKGDAFDDLFDSLI